MSTDEIRTRVARCIRDHYAAHGEAPSIRRLLDDAHVNRRQFYDAFRGLAEACHLAGVPTPQARINQTARANEVARGRPGHASTHTPAEVTTSILRVRDPARAPTRVAATHRQETAELRAALNVSRSRNAELQRALDPFLAAFGDAFFSTWRYDLMAKFHAFMTLWGYQGSFIDMLTDSVDIAMASKGVCYRDGEIREIDEEQATPRLIWPL